LDVEPLDNPDFVVASTPVDLDTDVYRRIDTIDVSLDGWDGVYLSGDLEWRKRWTEALVERAHHRGLGCCVSGVGAESLAWAQPADAVTITADEVDLLPELLTQDTWGDWV
jgi:hypothetical protein